MVVEFGSMKKMLAPSANAGIAEKLVSAMAVSALAADKFIKDFISVPPFEKLNQCLRPEVHSLGYRVRAADLFHFGITSRSYFALALVHG
jgi:hypothetical protein